MIILILYCLSEKRPEILLCRHRPPFIAELLTEMKSVFHPLFLWLLSFHPVHHSLCFHPLLLLSFSLFALFFPSLLLQSLWNCEAAGWGLFWQRNLTAIRITREHSGIPSPSLNDFAASLAHPPTQSTNHAHTNAHRHISYVHTAFLCLPPSPWNTHLDVHAQNRISTQRW